MEAIKNFFIKHKNRFVKNYQKMGKKRKGYLLLFLILTGVLLWAFVSAGVITHNFNRSMLKSAVNKQEIDVSGVILTETKDGERYWELYGEAGSYNNENNIAILDNVIGNFYKGKEVVMSFQATKGTYNEKRQQIILYDNTFIVTKDGVSLSTDRLVWSGSDKDIVVKGNVEIRSKNELLAKGNEGIISPDCSRFKIMGNTETKIYDSKEKK